MSKERWYCPVEECSNSESNKHWPAIKQCRTCNDLFFNALLGKSHYCCWEQEEPQCGHEGRHRCCNCLKEPE